MRQEVGIITLGIENLDSSKNFYVGGFNWETIHEDAETAMYQMNGFVLSTWLQSELEKDVIKFDLPRGGALTLAYIVNSPDEVQHYINRLSNYGGKVLRMPDAPTHGGIRGYIADPDDHIWEIIYNPVWKVDELGRATFSRN